MRNDSPQRTKTILAQTKRNVAHVPRVHRYAGEMERRSASLHSREPKLVARVPGMAEYALVDGTKWVGDCPACFGA
jgi:hypothetical protein